MRKQILLFSIACLGVMISIAQINKSDILLGGTFGYGNYSSQGNSSNSNANLSPRISYAIGKNSVLSVRLGYNYGKSEDATGNNVSKNSNFSGGLSWQNFFLIKEKLGWFTDLYGSFSRGYTKYQSTPSGNISKSNSTGYSAGVSPGIYFIPVSGLLLSANTGGISYGFSKFKSGGQETGKSSNFTVNLLNYFSFGIDFIINKKKI
jgi:hypothetical protein